MQGEPFIQRRQIASILERFERASIKPGAFFWLGPCISTLELCASQIILEIWVVLLGFEPTLREANGRAGMITAQCGAGLLRKIFPRQQPNALD